MEYITPILIGCVIGLCIGISVARTPAPPVTVIQVVPENQSSGDYLPLVLFVILVLVFLFVH